MACPVCNDTGTVLVHVYRSSADLPFGAWESRLCSAPSCVVAAVHRLQIQHELEKT